ncbi:MAG: DUF3499 domain-containing protein [Actinomycetota bacterium]|nr:DUF3499 domain-containing protein [Actinomycetota bacterium]
MHLCSKPGCGHAGAVILAYEYSQRRIVLDDRRDGEISPHAYSMCLRCVDRLSPPRGWEVEDRRSTTQLDQVGAATGIVLGTFLT